MLAYHLDPRNRDDKPSPEVVTQISNFFHKALPNNDAMDAMRDFLDMKCCTGKFNNTALWNHASVLTPAIWWEYRAPVSNLFRKLAVTFMRMPASSAASERAWSLFGIVCTKLRNRLNHEKLYKMVYIAWNEAKLSQRKFTGEDLSHIIEEIAAEEEDSSAVVDYVEAITFIAQNSDDIDETMTDELAEAEDERENAQIFTEEEQDHQTAQEKPEEPDYESSDEPSSQKTHPSSKNARSHRKIVKKLPNYEVLSESSGTPEDELSEPSASSAEEVVPSKKRGFHSIITTNRSLSKQFTEIEMNAKKK